MTGTEDVGADAHNRGGPPPRQPEPPTDPAPDVRTPPIGFEVLSPAEPAPSITAPATAPAAAVSPADVSPVAASPAALPSVAVSSVAASPVAASPVAASPVAASAPSSPSGSLVGVDVSPARPPEAQAAAEVGGSPPAADAAWDGSGAASPSGPVTADQPWGRPEQAPEAAGPAGWWPPPPPSASVVPLGDPDPAADSAIAGGQSGVAGALDPARPAARPGLFGPPPPPRPPHRWGLGAYVVVEAVFLVTSALLALVLGRSLMSSAGAVALALAVPTICAAALAVLITRIRGNGPRIDLGLQVTRRDVGVGLACGLAGLVITIPASVLYIAIVGTDATSAVGEALGDVRAGPVLAVTIFVVVVFVAPLCEEIVYRGLLWGAVERLGANRWWALVVTTIVFALAHFEFTRTPLLLVVAIPIGIARVITGRLSAGVIAHQINNLLPGIVLMLTVLGVIPMT